MEFTGFHGTDSLNVKSIKENNFNSSQEDDEWLGYGIYFFLEGISSATESAELWAKAEAWNNTTKSFDYNEFSVISVVVNSDAVIDLRVEDDLKAFNMVRNVMYRTHDTHFDPDKRHEHDRVIINLVVKYMEMDVVLSNLFIGSSFIRRKRIMSKIPNVTVMCVRNNEKIDISTLKIIKEGRVDEH